MASVMLIVAISRGAKIPGYLGDLELITPLEPFTASVLDFISFWALVAALGTAGIIITTVMVRGMMQARREERAELAEEA